ncbi:hypothetical protein, partial [Virgibacillus sp. SK37]|uniref:hypothetical protein n=1 Tax=Virgibacillus sp. SK37 TaxID=403957 RepID=UPI001B316743
KGISATKPLVSPVGKSSLSYGGEGSLASRWALELDVILINEHVESFPFLAANNRKPSQICEGYLY